MRTGACFRTRGIPKRITFGKWLYHAFHPCRWLYSKCHNIINANVSYSSGAAQFNILFHCLKWFCSLCRANDDNALEIDFEATDFTTPRMALPSSIGNGLNFLTKLMTSRLSKDSQSAKSFLEFLLALNHHGEVSIFNYQTGDEWNKQPTRMQHFQW